MTQVQDAPTTALHDSWRGWWRRWPDWAAYVAGAWSFGYGMLGVYWTLGGGGFPYGNGGDGEVRLSLISGVPAGAGGAVIAALGIVGAGAALAMARARAQGPGRVALPAFGWGLCAVLLFAVCDYRLLASVAYTPILMIGGLFGWPEGVSINDAWSWVEVNQLICVAGGLSWAAATVAYQRRSRAACATCGRSRHQAAWTRPLAAARWGRVAVYVAVTIPMLYAITRWAWALGIPLGISEQFLRDLHQGGGSWIGASLATMGAGGAILTLGLVQRWGEIFPRWISGLAGKRVPPALAIVPATVVSVLVAQAGVMFVRLAALGVFGEGAFLGIVMADDWAAVAPELLWPVWGLALGAATLAYYFRRRGACPDCART